MHSKIIFVLGVLLIFTVGCQPQPQAEKVDPEWYYPDGGIRTQGFEEVTRATNGQHITLTEWVDIKYLCLDVTETQRNICTTALTRSNPPKYTRTESIEIKLRVCSETLRNNCVVMDTNPSDVDFRKVYVLADDGTAIDFDGHTLIEPPNTWTDHPQKLKLTGRVTVIDGEGRLIAPIEKIEAAIQD